MSNYTKQLENLIEKNLGKTIVMYEELFWMAVEDRNWLVASNTIDRMESFFKLRGVLKDPEYLSRLNKLKASYQKQA